MRFVKDDTGRIVGDRAFNAGSVGRALLGDQLQRVRNDPQNTNRQLADLSGDQSLEPPVIGRRSEQQPQEQFLADELSLQVLHGPGDPRVSKVETLSRYARIDADRIEARQWQVSYGSPADGLRAEAQRSWSGTLLLERQPYGRPSCRPRRSRQSQRDSRRGSSASPATPRPARGLPAELGNLIKDSWAITARSARLS